MSDQEADLTTRFTWKKGKNGRSTLICDRPDGTRTWSKLHPFLPLHDLLHFAVETTFEFDQAFFGLLSSGWSVQRFSQPEATEQLPVEAKWAEHIVGMLDLERSSGRKWEVNDFNAGLSAALVAARVPPCPPVQAADLARIREMFAVLARQWSSLPPGGILELRWMPRS